jgi:hypothetical protein
MTEVLRATSVGPRSRSGGRWTVRSISGRGGGGLVIRGVRVEAAARRNQSKGQGQISLHTEYAS